MNCNDNQLADKLSRLITDALDDVHKIKTNPDYEIDMQVYHRPVLKNPAESYDDYICKVCFAGAVMVETLKAPFCLAITTDSFTGNTAGKLKALDNIRFYDVSGAIRRMNDVDGVSPDYGKNMELESKVLAEIEQVEYRSDPELWEANMRLIAERLKERGY